LKSFDQQAEFDAVVLPHLDAAYNLARWIAGNDHDAEDIAQEAALRALRFLAGFRGGSAKAWLLTIVRNTAFTWLKQNRPALFVSLETEDLHEIEDNAPAPSEAMMRSANVELLRKALADLPPLFREALILREIEGLSYKEIAEIVEAPIGTVMSRLGRARRQFQTIVQQKEAK
jgi:RNA polymerase sigma-70 factor (ECF subfamily)